jgi:hypothetical protein
MRIKQTKSDDLQYHLREFNESRYKTNADTKVMMYHAQEIKRLQNEKLDNKL